MKRTLRTLSVIMALLTLLSVTFVFSSCKNGGEAETSAPVGTVSSDDSLPPLEVKDLGGYEFKMLWPEVHADGHYLHSEIAVTAESEGDVIDSAVATRNATIEAAYNVKITVDKAFISDVAKNVRTEASSGDATYSALACAINNSNMVSLAQEGLLTDFNTLEYYDESQPWWNHDLMQDLSIANARYYASGDLIYSDDFYPYCTYVNVAVSNQYGITENYYELVKNKEWTLEKFHTLAVKVADGGLDGNADEWSAQDMNGAVVNPNFAKAAYYSAGKGMIGFDKQGYPVWQMELERTQDILEKIIHIVWDDGACFNSGTFDKHAPEEIKIFTQNKTLFLIEELIIAERITKSDSTADFMLLPFPLYDEDSEYVSILNDALVIGVPAPAADKDKISLVLSALSRESVNTLTPVFFDTVLTYRYMNNPESVETLQIILDSTVAPDIATVQNWGKMMSEFKNLAFTESTDFSSVYSKNIGTAMGMLEEYCVLLDNYYNS